MGFRLWFALDIEIHTWDKNEKFLVKKKETWSGKKISRICLETLLKSGNPHEKIITDKLDVKLGHFTENRCYTVLKMIKWWKDAGLMKSLLKYENQGNLMTYFFDYATLNTTKISHEWTKICILPFPTKTDFRILKNYRGITLCVVATQVYNDLIPKTIYVYIHLLTPLVWKKCGTRSIWQHFSFS